MTESTVEVEASKRFLKPSINHEYMERLHQQSHSMHFETYQAILSECECFTFASQTHQSFVVHYLTWHYDSSKTAYNISRILSASKSQGY